MSVLLFTDASCAEAIGGGIVVAVGTVITVATAPSMHRKEEAVKESRRGLRTGTDWRCEPAGPPDSVELECTFTAVDEGELCGRVELVCADGTHVAKVCVKLRFPGDSRPRRVRGFAPPLAAPARDCSRIRYTPADGLGSGEVVSEIATVDEVPLAQWTYRERPSGEPRACATIPVDVAPVDCTGQRVKAPPSSIPAACATPLTAWANASRRLLAVQSEQRRQKCEKRRAEAIVRAKKEARGADRVRAIKRVPKCSRPPAFVPVQPSQQEIDTLWSAVPAECRAHAREML